MKYRIRFLAAVGLVTPLLAGPFPPAAGQPGSDAIPANDPRFALWATSAVVERGPTEIGYPDSSLATFGDPVNATGPADATPSNPVPVVSLGDGGSATLEFAQPFGDAPGPDFAVFENGFSVSGSSASFLELAHVEVSSDGLHFFRFPSVSLTPSVATIGEGGAVNPTDVHNLAGKYLAGYGTPFDLAELRDCSPLLDIQRITHVRVIDVVGTNDPAFATHDSVGNIIIDPYPTPYFSSGFDLDAIGALSQTTTTYTAWATAQAIANRDPAAHSTPDGAPNIIKYLTGNARLETRVSAGTLTLSFSRLGYRTDGKLRVEGSPNLQQWTPLAESIHGAVMTALTANTQLAEVGEFARQVTLSLPADGLFKYFRLAAEP